VFDEQPSPLNPSVEAERLDAIGRMAAGVAHHLNNILMVVLGNIQLAVMDGVRPRPEARLRAAERAVRDAADVVRSLSAFCRTQPIPAMQPLDLNALVEDVVELTSPRWRDEAVARGVAVHVRVERGEVTPVTGNAPALRQVLMNLVLNAIEAMPEGGGLTLRTWADADGVHCSVADTGVGMSPEVRRHALEPFQTTKGPKTRGLGLAVAHGIVTRHGGTLTIDSIQGLGTSVVITLPAPGPRQPALTPEPATS
jgi:signal transduction histidine kinase